MSMDTAGKSAVNEINKLTKFKDLCLELSSQPSDYSYFKSDFMSTWAGPQHWRLRSKFSKGTYALNGRHATPVCGILRFGGEVTVFESVFICVLR